LLNRTLTIIPKGAIIIILRNVNFILFRKQNNRFILALIEYKIDTIKQFIIKKEQQKNAKGTIELARLITGGFPPNNLYTKLAYKITRVKLQKLNKVPYQGVFKICLYVLFAFNIRKENPATVTIIVNNGPYNIKAAS